MTGACAKLVLYVKTDTRGVFSSASHSSLALANGSDHTAFAATCPSTSVNICLPSLMMNKSRCLNQYEILTCSESLCVGVIKGVAVTESSTNKQPHLSKTINQSLFRNRRTRAFATPYKANARRPSGSRRVSGRRGTRRGLARRGRCEAARRPAADRQVEPRRRPSARVSLPR